MTLTMRGSQNETMAKPIAGRLGAHAEGTNTTASGAASHAEGTSCLASDTGAHAEGSTSSATALYAHAEGLLCVASGPNSHAQGNYAVSPRTAQHSLAAGLIVSGGDAQALALVHSKETTDATPAVLAGAGAVSIADPGATVLTALAARGFRFRIEAVARNVATGAGEFAGWTITGTIARGSTGSARILGTPVVVTDSDAGASTWTLAVSINTTNATYNYLAITATGEAGKTIRWVAAIYATEVG